MKANDFAIILFIGVIILEPFAEIVNSSRKQNASNMHIMAASCSSIGSMLGLPGSHTVREP
jgi:hypothetical protein